MVTVLTNLAGENRIILPELKGDARDRYLIEHRFYTPSQVEELKKAEQGLAKYFARTLIAREAVKFENPSGGYSEAYILFRPFYWLADRFDVLRHRIKPVNDKVVQEKYRKKAAEIDEE